MPDLPGATSVPLLWDPLIDALAREGTVSDDTEPVTPRLGHCTKRSDSDREGELVPNKRAEEAPMDQLLVNISPDILDTSCGRWMVPGGTGRLRGTDNTDVPAIHNGLNDGDEVPVVPKITGPSH
jgi:hypothetical protein